MALPLSDNRISAKWAELKDVLLPFDQNWQVWMDWYEDRLRGTDHPNSRPLIEALELERVLIADEDWEQGPQHVNAMIAALEAKYRPIDMVAGELDSPIDDEELASNPPPQCSPDSRIKVGGLCALASTICGVLAPIWIMQYI